MFPAAQIGVAPPGRLSMDCRSCRSGNLKTFSAEIGIHFPGLKNLDKPVVWVFPSLQVCLDCGFSEFFVPDEERSKLGDLDPESTRNLGRAG